MHGRTEWAKFISVFLFWTMLLITSDKIHDYEQESRPSYFTKLTTIQNSQNLRKDNQHLFREGSQFLLLYIRDVNSDELRCPTTHDRCFLVLYNALEVCIVT